MRHPTVIAIIVSVVTSLGLIAYVASISDFDLSGRVISDNVEGTETSQVENPAPPDHPAFPSSNLSAAENVTSR